MFNYHIITKYFAITYVRQLFLSSFVVIFVLLITSAFDILQRFKSTELSSSYFWQLILLKIPHIFCEVAPLCCFISTVLFLYKIVRQNELIVVLSSGIRIARVFTITLFISFLFGLITTFILAPIGTYGLKKYKEIEAKVTNAQNLNFVISDSGIFFFEKFAKNNRIIQTKSINSTKNTLSDVTILILDPQNNFIKRIDAPTASLDQGLFVLNDATVTFPSYFEENQVEIFDTNLSMNSLMQTFVAPDMISIWNLKETIENFTNSGIPTIRYQIRYYKQLFKPIFMIVMSLIACWFINLNVRDNSNAKNSLISLVFGVCVYFLLEIASHILAYSSIHPMIASLLPMMSIILLFHICKKLDILPSW
jgi:lipopolysaccharide export system permease protein